MKINLAKSAGFCFGVKRAIHIALETAASKANVYMLGDIVHNEDVVRQIQDAGIKKIKKLVPAKGRTLLLRAHGASLYTLRQARSMGYKIIDATCPMVKEIHKIARNHECRGFQIIVIGDKKHDEVQGIVGQLKSKAIVIDCPLNIPLKKIKNIKKCCVVVQSTQNLEMASEAARILRQYIPRLAFYNTICKPTRIKQDEIKRMPLENDVIIVIGSKNSANTKRLFEIARSFNKKSYWVNSKEEIKPSWFKNAHSVGVAAGASTPDAVIQSVICYLRLV